MNDLNVNKEVYDRYIDASVALFMEYYAATVLDGAKDDSSNSAAFPSDLDMRCRALIKRECARQNRKAFFKIAGKGLRIIACTVAAILCLSSVLFMTVEAVRIPIINYYIEQGDGYWIINGRPDLDAADHTDPIDVTNPLYGIIPNSFSLVSSYGMTLDDLMSFYEDDQGNTITLCTQPMTHVVVIDSEDAEASHTCQIMGYDTIISTEDGYITIALIHEDSTTTITLVTYGLDEVTTVSIIEQFVSKMS